MGKMPRSAGQILLLICSILGAGISIYLTAVHYENVPLVCSTHGLIDCARVLSSSYSVVPGTTIPISVPGLGWCIVSAALAIAALYLGIGRRSILLAQFVWSLLGMFTVISLVYVEIVRIHAICAWCTALHVLILLMFLVTVVQLQNPVLEYEADVEIEDEEPGVPTTSHRK